VSQARFQKRKRDEARRERAAAKQARRAERSAAVQDPRPSAGADQAAILAELAALHERFEAGQVTFEDFETAKQELTGRLDVE
jgi:hypothetical protein